MTPSEVYEAFIAAENDRDRDRMAQHLHPSLEVSMNGITQLADRDADAEATDRLLALYPGYRRHLHRVLVSAQTVVAQWEMTGSGNPAAEIADLAIHGCTVADVEEDVIVRAHLYTDSSALEHVLHPSRSAPGS